MSHDPHTAPSARQADAPERFIFADGTTYIRAALATAPARQTEAVTEALTRMVEEFGCTDPECEICAPARAALSAMDTPKGGGE